MAVSSLRLRVAKVRVKRELIRNRRGDFWIGSAGGRILLAGKLRQDFDVHHVGRFRVVCSCRMCIAYSGPISSFRLAGCWRAGLAEQVGWRRTTTVTSDSWTVLHVHDPQVPRYLVPHACVQPGVGVGVAGPKRSLHDTSAGRRVFPFHEGELGRAKHPGPVRVH